MTITLLFFIVIVAIALWWLLQQQLTAKPWLEEGVMPAGSKMGIDATRKIAGEGVVRDWPKDLVMSDAVRELVTRRWKEYGL